MPALHLGIVRVEAGGGAQGLEGGSRGQRLRFVFDPEYFISLNRYTYIYIYIYTLWTDLLLVDEIGFGTQTVC